MDSSVSGRTARVPAQVRQIRFYTVMLCLVWSVLVAFSAWWFYRGHLEELHSIAKAEAAVALETDILYRRWATHHGGVYVPVTDATQPSPHLAHIAERDLSTPSGRKLTLVNPAYMTRQVYELDNLTQLRGRARLISMKPLRPENLPDRWEEAALRRFEGGGKEFSEVVHIKGRPHLRQIRAFVTEKPCLKCHGHQGYRTGHVRGALSVTVPLDPLYRTLDRHLVESALTHGVIWFAGIGIIGIGSRKLAKTARRLGESEERYRTVAEYTADWEYWLGPDGSFRYISPSCRDLTGYSVEEFSLDPELMLRIIHPDDRKLYREHLEHIRYASRHEPLLFRIRAKDGQERWISHVCRSVHNPQGESVGQRASNRDVTFMKYAEEMLQQQAQQLEEEAVERQAAQDRLLHQQQELERLNHSLEERVLVAVEELRRKDQMMIVQNRQAAMGEMIGNIAHQWRQPLNALSLLLANIKDAHRYNELDERYLEESIGDGNRLIQKMSATITDFRNFFRPDKEKTAFSASQQVEQTITLMGSSFSRENISIRVEQEEEVVLFGFPNEFSQVLMNLLSNARDAILARQVPKGEVTIRICAGQGRGVVSMRDNGGGIAEGVMDRIFEPYFSTKEMGTGIGLYMSKMIIERNMEGKITAGNRGDGAEFVLEIPLAAGEAFNC